jgi:ubiquitin carboxyl-terminal hydrolase 22/27/51
MDLTECLDRFTAPETLSSDSYHCRKCNSAQKAEKRLKLSTLPPVLPVHLKRFSHSQKLSTSSKIDTKIRFPFTLNLDPYTSPPKQPKITITNNNKKDDDEDTSKKSKTKDKEKEKEKEKAKEAEKEKEKAEKDAKAAAEAAKIEPLYTLSSVIVHKGKIDSGHYVSYARQGGEWFRFDDSMVVRVEEKEVLGAEAYMLFYCVDGV